MRPTLYLRAPLGKLDSVIGTPPIRQSFIVSKLPIHHMDFQYRRRKKGKLLRVSSPLTDLLKLPQCCGVLAESTRMSNTLLDTIARSLAHPATSHLYLFSRHQTAPLTRPTSVAGTFFSPSSFALAMVLNDDKCANRATTCRRRGDKKRLEICPLSPRVSE